MHCVKCGEWSCHLEAMCQPPSCRRESSKGRVEQEGPKMGGVLSEMALGPISKRALLSSSKPSGS